ncbi:hypothetical protein SLE2022_102950 [Rubroshorea leprosula]
MSIFLHQAGIHKNRSGAIQRVLCLSFCRRFSSEKLELIPQSKKVNGPLRVIDIISRSRSVTSVRQSHLRLIQDFLQTDSERFSKQNFGNDFASWDSTGVSDFIDEILESSVVDKERSKKGTQHASFLSNAVSSCASTRDLLRGVQYHCLAITTGFVSNVYVGSSLIALYCKCEQMENAYKMFEEMPVKNVVSWTTIIAGFAQEWQIHLCLQLYRMMRQSAMKPNDFTLTSILRACTGSGALGQGRSAHCQTIQLGFYSYTHVANALISMYCKCGSLEDALYIFENLPGKDNVSWNSMIAGYAQHGLAQQAIDLFEEMKKKSMKPDAITFLGVLSSCRHAGLVEQGRLYFNSMVKHGVEPELDHYSCVVDLLGRAGLLEGARNLILKMPIPPNAILWGSLLSSCRLHGNIWIGIQAAESKLLVEPGCAATHVQLANLYASAKRWDQAARLRKQMKDRGLRTNPGCSWIEVKNEVYRFRAEDKSNSKGAAIVSVLDWLVDHMRSLGYVPETSGEEDDDALPSAFQVLN